MLENSKGEVTVLRTDLSRFFTVDSAILRIDDFAKDGEPGALMLLCTFYHDSLPTQIIINVSDFAMYNLIWVSNQR